MLPIHAIRDDILRAVAAGNRLVLSAPTGSGKTTQVPQFLLHANLPQPGIIVLQPRRLAARLVAQRVARELDSPLGQLVGYQTRHDSAISAQTRIRFITEGLFLRLLQHDPRLPGIGAVLLDEFHERNLASDASLALVKRLQESGRPDLRLIVMSATLDVKQVSAYLAAPSLETHGRAFPVDVRYLDKRPMKRQVIGQINRGSQELPVWDVAADALADVLDAEPEGDVLVFMPGSYEIRRTIESAQRLLGSSIDLFPLYSELPIAEQDRALAPSDQRKVIVATNVAETSITIEGIRHVIDSGQARVNRFDAQRGINVLAIEPISQASAEQRAGRAGRTAPGTCTRLWLQREHRLRPQFSTPEIRRLDLAEVVLQLKSFGILDVAAFPWLEAPDPVAVQQAIELLDELGALKTDGSLSDLGRSMSRLPMHPRLSRLLIEAASRGCLDRAALWAALISERDILQPGREKSFIDEIDPADLCSDFQPLERAFAFALDARFDPGRCAARGINALAAREVDRTRRLYSDALRALPSDTWHGHLARVAPRSGAPDGGLGGASPPADGRNHRPGGAESDVLPQSLLVAFPDHLAVLKNAGNLACAMTRSRRGQLDPATVARREGLVLPVEVRELGAGGSAKTVLSLVTLIERGWLDELEASRIHRQTLTLYNPDTQAVETVDRESFDGLVIFERPRHEVDRAVASSVLAEQVASGVLKLDRWDDDAEAWIARVQCVSAWFPERQLITYTPDDRRLIIEEICAGHTRYKEIRDKPVLSYIKDVLTWEQQQFVERMAPERIELPSGWRMKMEYAPGAAPRGRAKIQDFYGLTQSPVVAGGRVRVLLEILGPNFRPVQLTDDLAGFWQNLYPTLKKELSRKYPRHEWR